MTQHDGDEPTEQGRRKAPRSARATAPPPPQTDAGAHDAAVVVRFSMAAEHLEAHSVHLVGEFNDWSHTANPMARAGSQFVAEVALAPGRTYRYKFLIDGTRWENDWNADAYVANEFGGDDSVVDLSGGRAAPRADPDAPGAAVDQLTGEVPEPNEPA
jgi:hypothetical protein